MSDARSAAVPGPTARSRRGRRLRTESAADRGGQQRRQIAIMIAAIEEDARPQWTGRAGRDESR